MTACRGARLALRRLDDPESLALRNSLPSTGTTIEPFTSTSAFAIYDAAGTVIGRFPG